MRVKNFSGFMKTRKLNESSMDDSYQNDSNEYGTSPDGASSGMYGANPEDEEDDEPMTDEENEEGEDEPEEELTLEDLKSMIDDLSERLKKLEPEEEEEGEEEEGEEEPEGEEEQA